MDKRQNNLRACERSLATPDGQILFQELQSQLDPMSMESDNPTTIAYAAGRRDAYKYIEMLRDGSLLRGDNNE